MKINFVDSDFKVPTGLITNTLCLRMLTINDVIKDFDAVMSSASMLRELFPTWNSWPEGLTIEQNLIDLGWHQKEFQTRRSFAYTVVARDESRVIGCVYVYPTRREDFDAEIFLWARQSFLREPADKALEDIVKSWIDSEWPFSHVAYPGRTIDWATWGPSSPW